MADVENPTGTAASPPPNCAICLGPCTDKCFSDSCMHQFCFTCLLEWSKIKPVCPLCKQSFKSIIHNVKSNDEYDQHVVERQEIHTPQNLFEENEFVDLYLPPAPPSRHFQFRTTFTVDPRGELAIQQMLLTHPLTNSVYIPGYNPLPRFNNHRYNRRRDVSSSAYRRSIYSMNVWAVIPPQEIIGRYRETSPQFFSENPAARNRLVPWLNRELNALLEENTQQVMHLVDVILTHLSQHDIKGAFFRNMLSEYLDHKTDHFIHEFYSFMRSPYDMIGYDRHVSYAPRLATPIEVISDRDSDSDVAIVSVSTSVNMQPPATNPFDVPTLEVIEINSSDGESVIFVDSESRETVNTHHEEATNMAEANSGGEENRKTILPLKIRFKHKRQSRERKPKTKRKYRRSTSSSSTSSTSSSTSSDSSNNKSRKVRRKHKKLKRKEHRSHKKSSSSKSHFKRVLPSSESSSSYSSDDEPLLSRQRKKQAYDSDDHLPLSKLKSKVKRKKSIKRERKSRMPSERTETITSASCSNSQLPLINEHIDPPLSSYTTHLQEDSPNMDYVPMTSYYEYPLYEPPYQILPTNKIKSEVNDYDSVYSGPGPSGSGSSGSSGRLRSIIIKKENSKDLWYSRPCIKNDTSDED